MKIGEVGDVEVNYIFFCFFLSNFKQFLCKDSLFFDKVKFLEKINVIIQFEQTFPQLSNKLERKHRKPAKLSPH